MTVLVTGIGKGIGQALAQKFLAEGHDVVGTYFQSVPDFSHDKLTCIPLDLSDGASVVSAVHEIEKLGIKFDVLINNAGALFDEEETKVVIDKLRKTLEVNLIGTINFTEQILESVSSNAHIINISSRAGSHEMHLQEKSHEPFQYPAYRISKSALNMYTVFLSHQLAPRKITVSSVHPGWVRTDMGGEEADITPEEAASDIYKFALTRPESGQFWHNGKRLPW
ncbi:MAG: SDR family NAD(P)-dependent oxidoreductase [Patescibacteria group bacterium]